MTLRRGAEALVDEGGYQLPWEKQEFGFWWVAWV